MDALGNPIHVQLSAGNAHDVKVAQEIFGDVIRSMKMKKAAEPLLDRKYPPEQAAPLVGFATVNSFYRSFKDYYGLPPLEWVSKQQEIDL